MIRIFTKKNIPARPAAGLILLVSLLSAAQMLRAQTTWNGSAGTNWNTAANWTAGVPTASIHAVIPSAANAPVIMAGAAAEASSVHVQTDGSLTIQTDGSLTINGFFDHSDITAGFRNQGTVANHGQLVIGSTDDVGDRALWNQSVFHNHTGGQISIDRGLLANVGTFTNDAEITIGAIAPVGSFGLWNTNAGAFTNNSSGRISIDNAVSVGLNNSIGTFTNAGGIIIGATAGVGSEGIRNAADFQNATCAAVINIVSNAIINNTVTGTFDNAGSIIENASGNSSINSNTGIVQNFNGGTFTVGSGNAPVTTVGNIWTGCVDTDWATAGNWSAGVPTVTDHAVIPPAANAPVIMDGTAAVANSVHVHGGSLTIQTIGSLTINGLWYFDFGFWGYNGSFGNDGTVSNNGRLVIGVTAGVDTYGLRNHGTFTNHSGGEISIDGSTSTGLYNTNYVTFTNAGKITIGAIAPVGSEGIWNRAIINNNSGGRITIDRCSNLGVWAQEGEINNAGEIIIGSIADAGIDGIRNQRVINNNSGGLISIDRSTERGLNNTFGNITNAGRIIIGANHSVGSEGLRSVHTFTNSSGEISIDRTATTGLHTAGTFTNNGKITIGALTSVGSYGIYSSANFTNSSSGGIFIDHSSEAGLWNVSGNFTNVGEITIGANHSVGVNGLANSNYFVNHGGRITIDRSTVRGLFNWVHGAFDNGGLITIGANAEVGISGIRNEAGFTNHTCGEIYQYAPLFNNNAFTNNGLMLISTPGPHGNTAMTNFGVIAYPQGNLVPNVTNYEIIIAPVTFSGCGAISPAFSLGTPIDLTFEGIFTDAAATQAAGAYNVETNTFTADPELKEGVYDLFVKTTGWGLGCGNHRIVPWRLTIEDCSLPVTLISFDARAGENTAHLRWATSSELNASHFEVQRSADGKSFEPIGRVEARGVVGGDTDHGSYFFADATLNSQLSIIYYRLKMVDLDGTYEFSPIRSVRFKSMETALSAYPNPASGTLHVRTGHQGEVSWQVYDNTGRPLLNGRASGQEFPVDLRNLTPGVYHLKIRSDTSVKTYSFIRK